MISLEDRYHSYCEHIINIPYWEWMDLDSVRLVGQDLGTLDLGIFPDNIGEITIRESVVESVETSVPLPNLIKLSISSSHMKSFQIESAKKLGFLSLNNNALEEVTIPDGFITNLDLSDNPDLTEIRMNHQRLEIMSINVDNTPKLKALPELGSFVLYLACDNSPAIYGNKKSMTDIIV